MILIMQSIESKVVATIYGHGRGWAFTPTQFSRLGEPHAIIMALARLTRKGRIRRLTRGLYDYPRQHTQLGLLAPSPDMIASALAGRDAIRVQPSGGYAA